MWKTTADNPKAAIAGEHMQNHAYPAFADQARRIT
jgi:rubrerythrin